MTPGASEATRQSHADPALARELRRYLLIGKSIGGLVLLLSVALVVNGVSTGTRPVMFVFFGLILAEVGIVFIRFFRRPSTRQKWVQRKCPPRPMFLRLDPDTSDNALTALLFSSEDAAGKEDPLFRVGIHPHDTRSMRGSGPSQDGPVACSTYFDPESGAPAVIETEDAVFWRKD